MLLFLAACLIYLPLLIWSPPWSKDGYYQQINKVSLKEFHPSASLRYAHNEDGLIHIYGYTKTDGLKLVGYFLDRNDYTEMQGSKITNPFRLWFIKYLEWTSDE